MLYRHCYIRYFNSKAPCLKSDSRAGAGFNRVNTISSRVLFNDVEALCDIISELEWALMVLILLLAIPSRVLTVLQPCDTILSQQASEMDRKCCR